MNRLICRSKMFFRKNGSTILTCVGSAGVVVTTVMAVKATPKAMELIKTAEAEKGEKLTRMETIKTVGMTYAPTAVAGIATIASIFGANLLNKRAQASLISAYALLDQSFKDYKKKVEELYGEDASASVNEEIAKDRYDSTKTHSETDKVLFYDEFSGRYFHSSLVDILKVESAVNKILSECSGVYLNDVYEMLDIPVTDYGDYLGWSSMQIYEACWTTWLDFYTKKFTFEDGLECYILSFGFEPNPEFEEY